MVERTQSTKAFDKYQTRGAVHWREYFSKDPRVFNAYLAARYGWILRLAGDVKGKRVLDLGCGDGVLSYLLAQRGALVTGADTNDAGLQYARERVAARDPHKKLVCEFVHGSAYETSLPEKSFDLVVSCEVIEHLPEPDKMLMEIKRVLKQGGRIVLTTPYRITEIPQDANHVHEYMPHELKTLLAKHLSHVHMHLTHHLFWRSLYVYGFRIARGRPLGKWFINMFAILFGWNPFMVDYAARATRFDTFSTIAATATVD